MVSCMKTTALIYVRQSRTERDKLNDSLSLAVQEEKCRALPAVTECDEVIVYRDANKSARKARATFEAMTERIREGACRWSRTMTSRARSATAGCTWSSRR